MLCIYNKVENGMFIILHSAKLFVVYSLLGRWIQEKYFVAYNKNILWIEQKQLVDTRKIIILFCGYKKNNLWFEERRVSLQQKMNKTKPISSCLCYNLVLFCCILVIFSWIQEYLSSFLQCNICAFYAELHQL